MKKTFLILPILTATLAGCGTGAGGEHEPASARYAVMYEVYDDTGSTS